MRYSHVDIRASETNALEGSPLLGFLLTNKECAELGYVLRKELDEMLLDLSDSRLDKQVLVSIRERYKTVFRMYARLASPKELSLYTYNFQKKY